MVQIGSLSVFGLIFSCRTLPKLGHQPSFAAICCQNQYTCCHCVGMRRGVLRADALGFSVQASRLGAIDLGPDGHAMG